MSEQFYQTSAKQLRIGDTIRLGDEHFSKVLSVRPEEGSLIVGGPFNKTATALRVHTLDGSDFLVHPGQAFGVKRDPVPSRALQSQTFAALCSDVERSSFALKECP